MKRNNRLIPAIALALFLISLCACMDSGKTETSSAPPPPQTPPTQSELPHISPVTPALPTNQPEDESGLSAPGAISGEIVVTFNYEKQSGSASNQFAVWVEDMAGNYINTLYATKWTADGGHTRRPDSLAMWVEKSNIASMPDYYIDAISGATPRTSGSQSYTWNLT